MGETAKEPVVAGVKPIYLELREGKKYFWCSCGLSKRQPFCDGSHAGTDMEPIAYRAEKDGEEVLFCTCKRTADGPHCDGSHNGLPGAYVEDDPLSQENRAIKEVSFGDGPIAQLDDGCYVFSLARADFQERDGLRYVSIVTPEHGAQHQSQFYGEVTGQGPILSFGDRDVVLFVSRGGGELDISGRRLPVEAETGVHIRPGETFQLFASHPVAVYISACPAADDVEILAHHSGAFDDRHPDRLVRIDPAKRHAMASRFFQMLVDKTIGSQLATQFVGHIPKSKAAVHRHLYEEALIVQTGEGMMWTQTKKAPVMAGDVIFFPRKAPHSLESVSDDGMSVVGVIYPGDNPSINY